MRKTREQSTGECGTPVRETDLYGPVHDYLVARGYTVRGEVIGCDLTAVQGDDLIVVELKRSISLDLLVQAAQRQRVADSVYVAVPRPSDAWMRAHWRGVLHLLRRLELGVLFVTLAPACPRVDVLFHPLPYERKRSHRDRRAVLREAAGRSADFNLGGSVRSKLLTAYRENAIFVAVCLERHGPMAPARLRALGTGPKTLSILRSNVYDWFERVDRGVYALKAKGHAALEHYADLAGHYRRKLDEIAAAPPATPEPTPKARRPRRRSSDPVRGCE